MNGKEKSIKRRKRPSAYGRNPADYFSYMNELQVQDDGIPS